MGLSETDLQHLRQCVAPAPELEDEVREVRELRRRLHGATR
ncbi:MAG: hypothetical protein JWN91_2726 [Nocardioides sp.]|jgi:hypothetical protein|nr:hypothetical protein [Nocardioides sp.]